MLHQALHEVLHAVPPVVAHHEVREARSIAAADAVDVGRPRQAVPGAERGPAPLADDPGLHLGDGRRLRQTGEVHLRQEGAGEVVDGEAAELVAEVAVRLQAAALRGRERRLRRRPRRLLAISSIVIIAILLVVVIIAILLVVVIIAILLVVVIITILGAISPAGGVRAGAGAAGAAAGAGAGATLCVYIYIYIYRERERDT